MSEPAILARQLLRRADRAALGVSFADRQSGRTRPYVSFVLMALDHDLAPILLLSDLAEHSKAIAADDCVSLLIENTAGLDQPLTGARLTILGRAAKTTEQRLRQRYLAHHPDSAVYADFADFAIYRVEIERAHLVGGFGKIHWLEREALALPAALAEALPAAEPDILAHMNQDHAEAIDRYANRLANLPGQGWRMAGIDRDGIDLILGAARGRVEFDHPVVTAQQARAALITLVARAHETP
jgi:putative heme iron utilization protein